jgi:uncharacterized protein DUF1905
VTHEFVFRARIWLYDGASAWHFVTLPKPLSARIKRLAAGRNKALGTVPVEAWIGEARWRTSIFSDNKLAAYVLPIKAALRKREQLQAGITVEVLLVAEL